MIGKSNNLKVFKDMKYKLPRHESQSQLCLYLRKIGISFTKIITLFISITTSVDTEMCCPKGKCGCQYFILLT